MKKQLWFITGISSGLGKAIAETALSDGHFVIGSFRSESQLMKFNHQNKENALGLLLDISKPEDIENAVKLVQERFGKIDVLVNNAGVGFAGAIEETSLKEARQVMEVNFFGSLQVTKAFLPIFRQQKTGHIIQISSHGGMKAFAGFGIYNASKFALEGFSEALAQELAPLNIRVTIVEPGPFRTNFAGSSFIESGETIEAYDSTAGAFRNRMRKVHGLQQGDPEKGARAIVDIARHPQPPLRLPLGKIAVGSLQSKVDAVLKDLAEFRDIAESVVY